MTYLQLKRKNKFGNKTTIYNNEYYQSIKEADYAQELDLRVKAKDLKEWKRQVPIDLVVNGMKICTYKIDFVEIDMNGNEMWTEVKGLETPEWRLKWKLFEALYPEREKQVIK
jgi:hypothetical protein